MNSKKIIVIAFVLCALVSAGSLFAQQAAAPAPAAAVDARLISFDLGLNTAVKADTVAISAGHSFALDFVLTDNVKIGFSSTNLGATYNLVRFSYYISSLLGFTIGVGTETIPGPVTSLAGNAGLFFTPIRGGAAGGLFSALKVKLDYYFNGSANGLASGYVTLGLVSSIGL